MIAEACQTLRRNRERFLLPRSTEAIVQTLVEVARAWLAPHSPWRALALEQGPAATGLSRESLGEGLDGFFRQFSPRGWNALLVQELGHPQRLDRLVSNDAETFSGTASLARGPGVLVHWTAEESPLPLFTALVQGLLVRSAQFVRCAPGTSLLLRLLAHSLRDLEPKLASCLEIAEWPAGAEPLETALWTEADAVLACDDEERLAVLRRTCPGRVRLLAGTPKLGAGYVAREVLGSYDEAQVLASAARDVMAWDQLGPLAPHVVFVEMGGLLPPEKFAARLADELAKSETNCPRGAVPEPVRAALERHREFYRVRAAGGGPTQLWCSPGSTAWTVVYEPDPRFLVSPRRRFIHVKGVETTEECLHQAEAYRGVWTTVGLAADGVRGAELARTFAEWGITRICPLGRMQAPPLTWRPWGRPALGDLVTWAQWEQGG